MSTFHTNMANVVLLISRNVMFTPYNFPYKYSIYKNTLHVLPCPLGPLEPSRYLNAHV